jgi:predicted Rossmann fold flavoprotein
VVDWFASLGVPLHEEAHGKLFPDSNRSRDVLNALLAEVHAAGVELKTSARVDDLIPGPTQAISTANGHIHSAAVVLATGGLSLPKTGSDGGGLTIAARVGHTIIPTTPALVPLAAVDDSLHQRLSGVSQSVEVALWIDGRIATRLGGALLWTHFGVSGPVVLDVSRHWLRARFDDRDARLTINFAPGETFDAVDAKWLSFASATPHASLHTALSAIMPASVASEILRRIPLDPTMVLAHLPREARRRLSHALTEWPLEITSSRGYNYAEATAGGVALDEINPATMESLRCPGVYVVGEMLDVDGRIGGFNFQWAWASARTAATAIGRLF